MEQKKGGVSRSPLPPPSVPSRMKFLRTNPSHPSPRQYTATSFFSHCSIFSLHKNSSSLTTMGQIALQSQHKLRQKKRKKMGKHSKTENAKPGLFPPSAPSSAASSVPSFSSPVASPPHLSANSSRRPHLLRHDPSSSPPFSSLSSSSSSGPSLPRFHFALVLLSLSIISLAIICAFVCYFRILSEQRRARRQRHQQNAGRTADSPSNTSEKERLSRVNKFIVRPSNGAATANPSNCSSNKRIHQPTGANAYPQRIVPKITITSSGSECDGGAVFVQQISSLPSPTKASAEEENGRKDEEQNPNETRVEPEEEAVSRMRPEEFIQAMLMKVEREQGIG